MKIAISATTREVLEMMDSRFGRAPYFLIFDTQQRAWEIYANEKNAALGHSAGMQAARTLKTYGVNVVITGEVGPKALEVLRSDGVKIYCVVPGKVHDILGAFLKGQLAEYVAPNERREIQPKATDE